MTGELSPLGDGPGDEAMPELRASYADRDRVVEVLRVAAGDGRLTAAELDERVEAALTARTYRELERLTADLPAVPGSPGAPAQEAKDLVRIDCKGANAKRDGDWVVPRRMEVRAVGGTVKLDFTQAVITQPTLRIEAKVRGDGLGNHRVHGILLGCGRPFERVQYTFFLGGTTVSRRWRAALGRCRPDPVEA